jgi:putative molybdopterin biosynthesis protein
MPTGRVYLQDIPLSEARKRFQDALQAEGLWQPLGAEEVPLEKACGRVTAEAVWARISSPHYHAAAMDGFALRAAETSGASDRSPIELKVGEQAVYLDTGDPMPDWADAVVPIEDVEPLGGKADPRAPERIRLRSSLAPWAHVRLMGEDMVSTELVLPAGHALRPVDLGAIAASGHASVAVRIKPRVAIIPTGSELVPAGSEPQAGQIIEYNSLMLAAQVETWGGAAERFPIVPDDLTQLCEAVSRAAKQHDLVLVIAGSSAGAEDFTAQIVEKLGRLLVHGVAVRPGHPVILGLLKRAANAEARQGNAWVAVIGVPGYPVSAALTGEIFVEPLLARWLGIPARRPAQVKASLTRKVHSSLGDDEFLRVTLGRVGRRLVAAPLSRGAGVITSLVRADGIVRIPAGVQGLAEGETVAVDLYCSADEIERTILVLGSHDLTIDLMGQFLAGSNTRLTSANLGSLGGLLALQRGDAHLSGCHLLDPASGEYNLPYIRKYLPGRPIVVLALAERQQGLIVAPGNPKAIAGLGDLVRSNVSFINRQRGAGTRILLDYHLEKEGLPREPIRGYKREEYTHLAVAAAVSSGRVDCGLGIQAAAAALKMDFVPLYTERYDLVIPREHFESALLQPLLTLLSDPAFRRAVQALPGYDVALMGSIIAELS